MKKNGCIPGKGYICKQKSQLFKNGFNGNGEKGKDEGHVQ